MESGAVVGGVVGRDLGLLIAGVIDLVIGAIAKLLMPGKDPGAWDSLDFVGVVAPGVWVEAQQDWFRRRSLCAFSKRHAECLQAAYRERIAVLEALRVVASRPARQGGAAVCRDAPWGDARVRLRAPGRRGNGDRGWPLARPRRGDAARARQRPDAARRLHGRGDVTPSGAANRTARRLRTGRAALN